MDPDALSSSWRQHANGIRELVRDLLGDRQDAYGNACAPNTSACEHRTASPS